MIVAEDIRRALHRKPGDRPNARTFLGPDARDAAVVVPLSLSSPGAPVAFVLVRSAELRDHAGELGFPGGKVERGESLSAAALREVEEEIGVGAADVDLLGELTPVPVVTGRFLLHPFVAAVGSIPQITSSEHAELHEVPLARWLTDREEIEITEAPWRGLDLMVPHFRIGPHVMYGASAAIFFELLSLLSPRPLVTKMVDEKPWGDRYRREEKP
ncbi:MAG: CoA pyrophosphatase [Polyangiaceae bacterium]|nr:CoA pyrophosphatase [Polyangiaceae bacterium]